MIMMTRRKRKIKSAEVGVRDTRESRRRIHNETLFWRRSNPGTLRAKTEITATNIPLKESIVQIDGWKKSVGLEKKGWKLEEW